MPKKITTLEEYYASFERSKPKRNIIPDVDLVDYRDDIMSVMKILLDNNKRPQNGWYKRIANFILYDVPLDTWCERVNAIIETSKAFPQGGMPMTLESQKLLYGDNEGQKRWEKYRSKQSETNTFKYKKEQYGWTQEEFATYNKSRAVTVALMVERYGEDEGMRKWFDYCERQAYTNSLEYYIENYGADGESKWLELNKQKAGSQPTQSPVSNLEQEFVLQLTEYIGKPLDYSCQTKQYCVYTDDRAYFYDIVHNQRAIEFNGDYWHCNPKLYEANYYHRVMDLLAEDVWKRDKYKAEVLDKERNVKTMTIWEHDYRLNPDQQIKKAAEWIREEQVSNE